MEKTKIDCIALDKIWAEEYEDNYGYLFNKYAAGKCFFLTKGCLSDSYHLSKSIASISKGIGCFEKRGTDNGGKMSIIKTIENILNRLEKVEQSETKTKEADAKITQLQKQIDHMSALLEKHLDYTGLPKRHKVVTQ